MWQPLDPQPQQQPGSHVLKVQEEVLETKSRCSASSTWSTRSSASVAALKAKTEAVQAQVVYAEEEAEVMKQQAEMQAQLQKIS